MPDTTSWCGPFSSPRTQTRPRPSGIERSYLRQGFALSPVWPPLQSLKVRHPLRGYAWPFRSTSSVAPFKGPVGTLVYSAGRDLAEAVPQFVNPLAHCRDIGGIL